METMTAYSSRNIFFINEDNEALIHVISFDNWSNQDLIQHDANSNNQIDLHKLIEHMSI